MHVLRFFLIILTIPAGLYSVSGQDSMALDKDSIMWNVDVDEIVVTGQHEPMHYSRAVHSVRVIDGKTIEKMGMANLAEVLSTQLDMQITTDLILGNGLTMQGISGENVQIMIDGVPVIGRLEGNVDLSQIQMTNIRRIEIIKGTMSAQFGSNASGGVINLITRSSQVPKFELSTSNQIESKGVLDNTLSAGFRAGSFFIQGNIRRYHSQVEKTDSLRVMEQVILDDGTPFRSKKHPWNPKLQLSANASVKYQWNDSISIVYSYRHFDETVKSYGEKRRPDYKPYAFDDQYNTRRSDHALMAKGYLNDRWYFTTTQAINNYDRNLMTFRKNFEENSLEKISGSEDSTSYMSLLSRNMISYTSPLHLDIQAGVEWQQESASGTRLGSSNDEKPISTIRNAAGWLSLKYPLFSSLTILGNIRYGHNTRFDHPLLPSLQAHWKGNRRWSVRAGYSRGFRAPSLKEMVFEFIDVNHYILGNTDLHAETSSNINVDVSGSFSLGGSSLKSTIGLFSHQIENRIILAEYETAKYTYKNLDSFETHGIDIEFEYPFTENVTWRSGGGVTFLSNVFTESDIEQKYYKIWEWQNKLELYWPQVQTDFIITQKLTSRQQQFQLNENGEIIEGFIDGMNIIHASANRSFFDDQLTLSVGVKNLLDVQSVAIQGGGGSGANAHTSIGNSRVVDWGRSFFIGLNYTFAK